MSNIFAFLLTLAGLSAALFGMYKPDPVWFTAAVAYCPPYFIRHALDGRILEVTENPLFPFIVLFHFVKYVSLARSQFTLDKHSLHYLAVIFEVAYLAIGISHL